MDTTARAPRRRRLASAVAAIAVVASACGGAAGDGAQAAADADAGDEGACAEATSTVAFDRSSGLGALPAASFPTLADPEVVVCTSDWEGTPTVVNFWATWCGFCLEEMPALESASERLGEDVRFVGIDRQDNRDDALAFVERTGVTYDQLSSREGEYYVALGARGMPTTLFVDEQGTIVWRHTGPLEEEQVLDLVAEHLGVGA